MLHQYSDNDIDEHELRHENKDDKEDGRNDGGHAAVSLTVVRLVTIFSQCVLLSKMRHQYSCMTIWKSQLCN